MNSENGALEGWEEMKSLAGEDRTGEGEEQQAAVMDRERCTTTTGGERICYPDSWPFPG